MSAKLVLTLAIVATVYLIYLGGAAIILSMHVNLFVLPVFEWANANTVGVLLNWTAGVAVVLWGYWGLLVYWADHDRG